MDFRQLTYITTIAEEKNITKAAKKLYITRSALNYCLLNTEKALGFSLFKRISNKMIPTYAGEIFLDNARKVMASCKEMDHSMLTLSDSSLLAAGRPPSVACFRISINDIHLSR